MNYNEAIEYIHNTKKFGSKLGLENIKYLLKLLGNPHKKLKFIHIAGTNGKGSTSSYITSILAEAGYKVGLFTSPYLERFNERIRINEDNIPDRKLANITEIVKEKVNLMVSSGYNHPTEFEIVTAIAMKYYFEEKTDFVVLEVGLGGRFDSTNVIENSIASVITPISMDHTDILGDTLGKIAREKAGIIKENGLVILYPQEKEAEESIKEVAKNKKAHIINVPLENIREKKVSEYGSSFTFNYKDVELDIGIKLLGDHQIFNASTAIVTLLELKNRKLIKLEKNSIKEGIKNTRWNGRLEVLHRKPTFLIDGAHNVQGIQSLKKALKSIFKFNRLILGVGILKDKEVDNMISELIPIADEVVVTQPNIFRALKAEELASRISKYTSNYVVEDNLEKAVKESFRLSTENDLIVFAGSLYLIGDIRKIVKNQ